MKKCRSVYELEFFWLVHRVQSETMGCTKKKKKKNQPNMCTQLLLGLLEKLSVTL